MPAFYELCTYLQNYLCLCMFECLVISHHKLRKLDNGSGDDVTGKSVFCFAATSSEKEQGHEKIIVCKCCVLIIIVHYDLQWSHECNSK